MFPSPEKIHFPLNHQLTIRLPQFESPLLHRKSDFFSQTGTWSLPIISDDLFCTLLQLTHLISSTKRQIALHLHADEAETTASDTADAAAPHVHWAVDTVDNEGMGKKSSKCE